MAKFLHTPAEIAAELWTEVSEAKYHEMLGCLPPARHAAGAFAVGECLCHTDDGWPVHEMYVEISGRYFTKPGMLKDFDRNRFVHEICRQLAKMG